MDISKIRWLHRTTVDGDVYYDRESRTIYRNRNLKLQSEVLDLCSLPTFDIRSPLKVYFDFTYLCNLECRHCLTNSSPRANRQQELHPERVISVIDELASLSVLELGIGGGEPFAHPDTFVLLKHALNTGMNTVLTTNGLLITPVYARRLKELQIPEVRVSLDGSKSVHESIRGAGTYEKALQALRILVQNRVNVAARITLCNDEKEGLAQLFKDIAGTGVKSVKASVMELKGRAALIENQSLLKYPRDENTAEYLLELAKSNQLTLKLSADMATLFKLFDNGELRQGERKSCGAGLETGYISPSGNVQPCSGITSYVFGNVLVNSFRDIWNGIAASKWRQQSLCSGDWYLCKMIENESKPLLHSTSVPIDKASNF